MREIKFRFWDSEHKHYIVERAIAVKGNGDLIWWAGDDVSMEIIAEQFTGLKDKNGVEIYEGDIVSGTWTSCDVKKTERLLVEYANDCFYPFFEPTGSTSGMLYETSIYSENFEVIGNIHQHKHLLED